MNKVVITAQDGAFAVDSREMKCSESEYLGLLIEAYLFESNRLMRAHVCHDSSCYFKEFHQGMIASITSTTNMINLTHRKRTDNDDLMSA